MFGVLLFLVFFSEMIWAEQKLRTHLNVIRNCENSRNLIFTLKKVRIVKVGFRDAINVTINFEEDLFYAADPIRLEVDMLRCRSKENPDSCAHFVELKTSRICKIIFSKFYGVADALSQIRPNITSCPIRKGVYTCRNCEFDGSKFPIFGLREYYWKYTIRLLRQTHLLGCFYVESYLFRDGHT